MNANPNAIRILCFGDSNTWGYKPLTNHSRFDANVRWTGILQEMLGSDFEIIEEGLNSRTLVSDDPRPGKEGRKGSEYLIPCLDTHDPIDLVVLMIGTTELKEDFDKSAEQIVEDLENNFVNIILNRKSQFRDTKPRLLLVASPIIDDTKEYAKKHKYSIENSIKLAKILKSKYMESSKLTFIDGNDCLIAGGDGVHIDEVSHRKLAENLHLKIKELY